MSKNNMNQTINKQEATVVATPNGNIQVEPTTEHISRAVYADYVKQVSDIVNTVKSSSLELARLFTEMDERKVLDFEQDDLDNGHAVRFQSMSAFAEAVLGINLSDRQLSDYKKVVHKFGVKQANGTYTLDTKYKVYGFSALEIISRKCETADDFDKVLAFYQLSSTMSDNKLKLAIKAKDNEGKEDDNESEEKPKAEKKDTAKELKEAKKELAETTEKLEKMTNSNNGGMNHLRDILKLAEENKCQPIIDYYKKWKLDDSIKIHFGEQR